MDIPAIFASHRADGLVAVPAWFDGVRPVAVGAPVPFDEATASIPRSEERLPAVVVDFDSLSERTFSERVMKTMRVRGSDIWFMTHIETVDDLFDAFNTSADIVMGAYHSSVSDAELEDIHSVSDSFVPVVYAVGGRAVLRQGKPGDLLVTLSALADIGFYRTCVLDTDGSVTEATWEEIFDGFPSAVPFTRRRSGPEGPSRLWVSCLRARGCPR